MNIYIYIYIYIYMCMYIYPLYTIFVSKCIHRH